SGEASSSRSGSNRGPMAIETVVVTGERVNRSLTDTVSSVAVLTEESMENSVILELDELLQRVPNVSMLPDGNGLSIRGIDQQGIGNGTFDPVSPTSAIYIDGAVQTQSAVGNGVLSTWDISQVEVFRGPQTATQGRSGLAGAVIMNTASPGDEWNARARLVATDLNREQLSLAGGGPLVDGVLGARLAIETIRNDGYTEFDNDGSFLGDPGRNNRDFVRGKLRFTPNDRLEAVLGITYVEGERGTNQVSGPDFFDGKTTQIVNIRESEVATGSLMLNYQLNDAWSLRAVTGFTKLDSETTVDPNTAGGLGLAAPAEGDDRTLSQEIQLTYDDGGPLRGIAGVYYADVEENFERSLEGITTIPGIGTLLFFRNDGFEKAFENISVYGQLEYDLSDRLTVTLGGRFESEEREFTNFAITDVEPDVPFIPDEESIFVGSGSDTVWLPKLGLTYEINDSLSINGTFQQAYRPAGTSFDPSDNSEVQFDPELSDNFDIALRASLFEERLLVNVNLFYIEYRDMQIRVTPDPAFPIIRFVDNAGESELYGLELESLWTLDERWSFYASAAFQESEFLDFALFGMDATGDEFTFSPAFSAALGGTWRHPDGWTGTLDLVHVGEYFSLIPNSETSVVDAYTILGGRFGYDAGTWGAYVFGENLLDEDYLLSVNRTGTPQEWIGNLGQPQTFGVILEARF
ncbi:MAG: TonB-dependent receptor, partial [Pseudomonadota bacterium]